MLAQHVTDFTKSPEEILVDLINADNGTAFLPITLAFGFPQPLLENATRNTEVEVYAAPSSGYSGSVMVRYNRIDLASVPGTRSKTFAIGTAKRLKDLIPQINQRYGINLTTVDYIDAALPVIAEGQTSTIDLVAGIDSLVWINKLQLTLNEPAQEGIYLNTVITDTYLDTLKFVQPVIDDQFNEL